MSIFRNLYLSLFISFYHLGRKQWPAAFEFDLYKGVIWQSIVMWFLISSPFNIIPVFYNPHIYKPTLLLLSIGLSGINWHVIINSGAGYRFVEEFRGFPRRRQMAFYFTAASITLLAGGLFYITGSRHRYAIGIR